MSPESSLTESSYVRFILIALTWTAWCVLHSVTIALGETDWLRRRLGRSLPYYRLAFNALAVVTLVPAMILTAQSRGPALLTWNGLLRGVQILLIGASVLLFVAGARRYDLEEVLGLNQIRRGRSGAVPVGPEVFETTGILGVTRHPWYLGALLLIWARDLDAAGLVTNAVLTVYLFGGTMLEERKLVRVLGDAYRSYQREVSMLIPWRWLRSRFRSRSNESA